MTVQDGIAYLIVAVAAGITLRHFYRKYVKSPLANFLLQRGKVKLAMRIRNGKPKDESCH
jgi:hypothetical protein